MEEPTGQILSPYYAQNFEKNFVGVGWKGMGVQTYFSVKLWAKIWTKD